MLSGRNPLKLSWLPFVLSAAFWLLGKASTVGAASGKWARRWQHSVDLHGGLDAESSSASEAGSSDLPFKCSRCNRGYQVAQSLQRHRWMCEKSRPLTCEVCLATFYRVDRLRRHMKTVHRLDSHAQGKW